MVHNKVNTHSVIFFTRYNRNKIFSKHPQTSVSNVTFVTFFPRHYNVKLSVIYSVNRFYIKPTKLRVRYFSQSRIRIIFNDLTVTIQKPLKTLFREKVLGLIKKNPLHSPPIERKRIKNLI